MNNHSNYLKWEDAVVRFKLYKSHQKADIKELFIEFQQYAINWVAKPEGRSLYLSGCPGCGKTYALVALLKALTDKKIYSWDVLFIRSHELERELLKSIEERYEEDSIEKYSTTRFLFLDDVGVERSNERVLKQYFEIFDARFHNNLSTVLTSNILRKNIHSFLGDRIASRLYLATEIIFPTKDLRIGGQK